MTCLIATESCESSRFHYQRGDFVQIKISTRHGTLSEGTREKITAKLEKLTRVFDRLSEISVTVDLEHRDDPTVDLKVSAEHKHDFVATVRAGELMTSVDQVVHKLESQLRKYKQKIQDRHRGGSVRKQEVVDGQEPRDE
jgi:putative sigma-54 modulation protein